VSSPLIEQLDAGRLDVVFAKRFRARRTAPRACRREQARRPCIRRRKVAIRYRKPIWTGGAVSASLRLSSSGIAIAKEHEIQFLAEASLTPRNIAGL
jgi:hypothetical protein